VLFIAECFAFCGAGVIFAMVFQFYKKSIGKLFGIKGENITNTK
jgi:hypothetical protein